MSELTGEKLALHGGKPVRSEFLVYGAPDIGQDEIDEAVACLKSGWLSTGPRAKRLEADLTAYTGAKYALCTNSCTAALHLCLAANGIGPGDEVITTPLTFAATANVIEHVGATVVLADIAADSMHIDPEAIRQRITPRTKAIIPVHFAGFPCDMDRIQKIADQHGLVVIEDAAHAIGTQYRGRQIGSSGNAVCFSFYVTKNIAAGEGGAVLLGNEQKADLMRVYALHGMSHGAWQRYAKDANLHYEIVYPGFKYNMPDITAAIAIPQLRRLEGFLARREQLAKQYFSLMGQESALELPHVLQNVEPGTRCSWHLYPVQLNAEKIGATREDVMRAIIQENVGVATHYRPLFQQKYYAEKYRFDPAEFPNARRVGDSIFSIPLVTGMSDADQLDVVHAFTKVLDYFRARA